MALYYYKNNGKGDFLKRYIYFIWFFLAGLILTACSNNGPEIKNDETLTVSAASSLTEVLTELTEKFQEKKGMKIHLNLDSSGTLQKQIEEGAPVDIFISAAEYQMDVLEKGGFLLEGSRENLLKNALVVVKTHDGIEIKKIEDLKKVEGPIAVAEMETVPAGQYTKEALENIGLLEDLKEKFIIGKNVKTTLQYVERGEAEFGFVFLSDGLQGENTEILLEIDSSFHKPIHYPIAIIKDSKEQELAKKFLDYLKTDESLATFEKYGFKKGE